MQSSLRLACFALVLTALLGTIAPAVFSQQEQTPPSAPPVPSSQKAIPTMRLAWSSPQVESVFWRGLAILRVIYWMTITCHFLLAIEVFLDIRKRGEGNLLFVSLTLLGGFLAAGVYALFRIANKKAEVSRS